jgi:hypothetical protein
LMLPEFFMTIKPHRASPSWAVALNMAQQYCTGDSDQGAVLLDDRLGSVTLDNHHTAD